MSASQTENPLPIIYANGRALPSIAPLLSVPATTFQDRDFALDDDCVQLCLNVSACSGRSYAYESDELRSVVNRLSKEFIGQRQLLIQKIGEWNDERQYFDGTPAEVLNVWLATFDLIAMACDEGANVRIEDQNTEREAQCRKQAERWAAFFDQQKKNLR